MSIQFSAFTKPWRKPIPERGRFAQALNVTGERYGVERRYSDYRQMIEDLASRIDPAVRVPELVYSGAPASK